MKPARPAGTQERRLAGSQARRLAGAALLLLRKKPAASSSNAEKAGRDLGSSRVRMAAVLLPLAEELLECLQGVVLAKKAEPRLMHRRM